MYLIGFIIRIYNDALSSECQIGMYSLNMAMSCRNMSLWSDYKVVYSVCAFSWYIKQKYDTALCNVKH